MNRLNIQNGGHEFSMTDIEYLQAALTDVLLGLGGGLGGNVIVSGCIVTIVGGATVNVSDGYLIINNEPCYFAGITGINKSLWDANFYNWIVAEVNEAPTVTYADQSVVNVYKRRNASLALAPTTSSTNNSLALILRRIGSTEWRIVPANGSTEADKFSANCETFPAFPFSYRRGLGGTLQFRGLFYTNVAGTGLTNIVVFTLPQEFRPTFDITVPAFGAAGIGPINSSRLFIEAATGIVRILFNSPGNDAQQYSASNQAVLPTF
jgi:hypothetical protein